MMDPNASLILWGLQLGVNLVVLILLWLRRAMPPIKSRSFFWLVMGLVFGELQMSGYLWRQYKYQAECHYFRFSLYLLYAGFFMCMIVRCWKLHFVYNINKSKILGTGDKTWFHRNKYLVTDKFLLRVFFSVEAVLLICAVFIYAKYPLGSGAAPYYKCFKLPRLEVYFNAGIMGFFLLILLGFLYFLRNIDDGFKISTELKVSIVSMAAFVIIGLAVPAKHPKIISYVGLIPTTWVMCAPILLNFCFSLYFPLYLTFTSAWNEGLHHATPLSSPRVRRDSLLHAPKDPADDETEHVEFFLSNPQGFEPYLRFLHSEFQAELLLLWKDIDDYFKLMDDLEKKEKSDYIYEMYLDQNSSRYLGHELAITGKPTEGDLINLRTVLEKKMNDSFHRFKGSKLYKQFVCSIQINESLVEIGLQAASPV